MTKRCSWANASSVLMQYHDDEWGKPLHDDQKLFEMLILESMSCGLSWEIVLKKRAHMRKVFDDFVPEVVLQYDDAKIKSLMQDAGIIRHEAKIQAVIDNANAYLKLKQNGLFGDFLWRYVNHKTIVNDGTQIITKNNISDQLSKDLKKIGFKFVGSTIIYSFMQAVGMINDHQLDCFARYKL